ncbi:MAG: hypothetical protein WCE63_23265 [Acidobacteriaceae bacterium]
MTGRSLKLHRLVDVPAPSKTGPWGGWTLYADKKSLHLLVGGNEIYGIRLEEIHDSPSMLDWIMQVSHKRWATDKILADLVHALDQLFDPQKNFCSLGRAPRTPRIATARSSKRRFPVGTRVHLLCAPEYAGEVIGFDGDAVLVAFRVGEQIATGRHSPDALETMEGQAAS